MSNYYYFVASLPTLRYEDRDPMSTESFLAWAAEHMSAEDMDQVRAATIDAPEPDPPDWAGAALRSWLSFERGLRNALARSRAQKAGAEVARFLRVDQTGESNVFEHEDTVRDAIGNESPLGGEDVINQARFACADEIGVNHFFDVDAVVSYYIKLQILNRRSRFNRKEGESRFAEINERIMNEYYQETKV